MMAPGIGAADGVNNRVTDHVLQRQLYGVFKIASSLRS